MDDLELDPRFAQLTAEMAWLRRLARALLRGDDAQDLAQEAWLVAAERRPTDDRPLRPWLSRVTLNLVRMHARARQRRETREQATAEPTQSVPQPDELVQRVELQRLVAGEVLRLAEPYRSTVLLHFFEELTCAEIAHRCELPEGTVRRRLKVALDELRARVDARERRSGGLAVLAPLVGLEAASLPFAPLALGVIAMKKLIAAVVVLVVLIAGMIAWHEHAAERRTAPAAGASAGIGVTRGGTPDDRGEAPVPEWLAQQGVKPRRIAGRVTFRGAPVAGASVELASTASEAGLVAAPRRTTDGAGAFDFGPRPAMEWSVRASAPGKTSTALAIDLRDPTASPTPDRLELALGACSAAMYGTIRDASGGPIVGARVTALRSNATSAVPGGPGVSSDEHGAYELCIETHWPGWVNAEVSAEGYAAVRYRAIVPGRVEVNFALVPEATIVGRVIRDDTHEPVPHAYVFVPSPVSGIDGAPARATFSDGDGRFRIDRLNAGRHLVFARAAGFVDASTGVPVALGVGQTSAEIEIRLEAGSIVRGKVLDGDQPVAGAHVVALDNQAVRGSAVSQGDGSFALAGVPRGEIHFTAYPYDVEKPERFRVTQPTHDGVILEVAPRGSIVGQVVRGEQPVPGAAIDIRGPNDDELGDVRADANGHFEARGLAPGPWTLFAEDPARGAFGRAPRTIRLSRGETQEVTIDLAYAASISGRVIDQNGSPVPGVTVQFLNTRSDDVGVTATASDGTFRAASMTGGGDYRPQVRRGMPSRVELRPAAGGEFPTIALADGEAEVTDVVLAVQLDRLAISGRVVDSDGAPVSDARVIAELVEGARPPRFFTGLQHPADTSDVDGRFSIGDLLAGTYALSVQSPAGVNATVADIAAGRSDVTVVLPTPGALEVTTVGFQSTPQVSAIRGDRVGAEVPRVATAQGNVSMFRSLAPGSYVVTARTQAEAATTTVEVVAGRTTRATLTSTGSGVVAGHVRAFRTGKPIEGMTCRALPRRGIEAAPAPPGDGVRTDAQGAYLIAAAPAGQIAIWCDGLWRNYSNGLRLVTLAASQRIEVDVPVVELSEEPGMTLGGIGAGLEGGVLVPRLASVAPGGPAATAGLRDGDVIVAVDGASVTELSPIGVWLLIINRAPGSHIKVTVTRAGKSVTADVVLGDAR